MRSRQWLQFGFTTTVLVLGTLSTLPALSNNSNFGTLTLSGSGSASASGQTTGSFSLSALSNRDIHNNICLGYAADQTVPDHVLVLSGNPVRLKIQVSSSKNDTTLLVDGPGGIRCGDTVIQENFQPGTYKIWVGGSEPNDKRKYTLSISS